MGGPNPNPFGFTASGPAIATALQGQTIAGALTVGQLTLAGTPFGPLDIATVGVGLKVGEGANAKQGTSTLAAGTVVVANTNVTASSRIFITGQSLGTVTVFSAYGVSARTAGTSFTILASQATDTSVVAWEIFEPG